MKMKEGKKDELSNARKTESEETQAEATEAIFIGTQDGLRPKKCTQPPPAHTQTHTQNTSSN